MSAAIETNNLGKRYGDVTALDGLSLRVAKVATCLAIALATPIAFSASAWHGYLPPIGVMILAMGLAQLINAAGWGEYFPWAVPALYVQGENLGTVSYVVVILTCIVGMIGTFICWEWADQTH